MNDMNDDPFERQVADVTRRAVGLPREVDALGVAREAAAPARSWGWTSSVGVLKFVISGLVVAAFAGFLFFSGVLDADRTPDRPQLVGASPLASADPSATAVATASVDR